MTFTTTESEINYGEDAEGYPTRDDELMAETEQHQLEMSNTIHALRAHFAARPDVYVAGNNFVYWEQGNRNARVAPDCYVVFGVEKRVRPSYKAWNENGKLPDVVFEFTSEETKDRDSHEKRPLYEQVWNVSEYFQFGPTGDYLDPRLQGFRLYNGRYYRIPAERGRMYSLMLDLDLVVVEGSLRLSDPRSGILLPTLTEAMAKIREIEIQAVQEAMARYDAELRAEAEAQRAEIEAQARGEIEQSFQAEAEARAAAEAEIARLKAELEALRQKP